MSIIACIWPDCDSEQYVREICRKHYARAYRLGNFEKPWIAWEAKNNPKPELCKWPGCGDISKVRGFCKRDYTRASRRENFDNPWDEWSDPGRHCGWPDCDREVDYIGFCDMHARRSRSVGTLEKPWVIWNERKARESEGVDCVWPECSRRAHAQGLCTKHYQRAKNAEDFDQPWAVWNPAKGCQWCGEEFIRAIPRAMFCSPVCSRNSFEHHNPEAIRNRNRRRRASMKSVECEKFTESDVRALTGDNCYLCGKVINFDLRYPNRKYPSLDHIVPISKGGSHTLDNVAMTHLDCNQRKSARLVPHGPQIALF